MHVQDLTDFVLLREIARRYPPSAAPNKIIRDGGFMESVIPAGKDNCVYLTFDSEALDIVLHPIPASER